MWEKKFPWWKWLTHKTFRYDMGDDAGYAEMNAILDGGDLTVTVRPNWTDNPFDDLLKVYLGITRAVCEMSGMTPANYTRAVHSIFQNEEEYGPLLTYNSGKDLFSISSDGNVHKEVAGKWYPLYREKPPKKEKKKVKKEEPPKVFMDKQSKKYRVSKVAPKDCRDVQNDDEDVFGVYSKFHGSSFWYFDENFGLYESAEDAQAELDAYAQEQGWEVCKG